ncbi:hypothetical protein [Streptomyces sp. NPDC053427]|uniref:hypothetical protein n=1 Tax=Streptomyces sp. NPDC053427 TaxID=3365701 RepID=UPI0037D9311C
MAKIADLIKKFSGNEEEKAKVLFSLGVLNKLATTKTDDFEAKMGTLHEDPQTVVKYKANPGNHSLMQYVQVTKAPNPVLSQIIDTVLGYGDKESKKVIGGTLTMLVDAFLGNVSVGEQYDWTTQTTISGPSIIRVDSMVWNYHFKSVGLTVDSQNAFAYGVTRSVVRADELSEWDLKDLLFQMITKRHPTWTEDQKDTWIAEQMKRFKPVHEQMLLKQGKLNALQNAVNTHVTNPSGLVRNHDDKALYIVSTDQAKVWAVTPDDEKNPVTLIAGGGNDEQATDPLQAKLVDPVDIAYNGKKLYIGERRGRVRCLDLENKKLSIRHDDTADGYRLARLAAGGNNGNVTAVTYKDGEDKPLRIAHLTKDGATYIYQSQLASGSQHPEIKDPTIHGVTMLPNSDVVHLAMSGHNLISTLDTGSKQLDKHTGGGDVHSDTVLVVIDQNDPSKNRPLLPSETSVRRPQGLAYDSEGSLYFADVDPLTQHGRIRKITKDGKTVLGVGSGRNPYSIAVDLDGLVLFQLCDAKGKGQRGKRVFTAGELGPWAAEKKLHERDA